MRQLLHHVKNAKTTRTSAASGSAETYILVFVFHRINVRGLVDIARLVASEISHQSSISLLVR
jgi:hypothetical protein